LEGVREVLDDEAAAGPEEREDVVADLEVGETRDVLLAEADELLAFGSVDGFVPRAGREALARFHFADDEGLAAADDEVDLAALRPNVAVDDAIAADAVKPRRSLLATAAELARVDALSGDGSASRCRCA
jgi:hypothetical protein